jgi:hypothetical protein
VIDKEATIRGCLSHILTDELLILIHFDFLGGGSTLFLAGVVIRGFSKLRNLNEFIEDLENLFLKSEAGLKWIYRGFLFVQIGVRVINCDDLISKCFESRIIVESG